MTKYSSVSQLPFQNALVRQLARDSYNHTDLEALRRLLRDRGTLRLMRYSSGGCSAVTPLDAACLEAAISGELIFMWDRDSIMQAIAELLVACDPSLGEGLQIEPAAFKKGLLASLSFHYNSQNRFMDFIQNRRSGMNDKGNRPNVRYNPVGLTEVSETWGEAQNDALGAINWFLFYTLNRGMFSWDDPALKPIAEAVLTLIHAFFWKIEVWHDWDFAAWEDDTAEHASSIGIVLAGLREQLKFMQASGLNFSYTTEGVRLYCDSRGVAQLIANCEEKLSELLPREFIRGSKGVRDVDVALVDALFLSALSGRPLVDDAMTVTIINNIEKELIGHIGISRYPGDVWDGRQNRAGVPSAQWSHVSPMISYVVGEMYQRLNRQEYLEWQLFHFNRGLACVNERFHVPEAYIAYPDGKGGWLWVSDANESLAWAQAMVIASFAGIKQSIDFRKS